MKAIKLFLIFFLILGGIVLAFYIIPRPEPVPIIGLDSASLRQYREQFEKDWETAGDWNEDVFKSHCDLVKQLEKQNYDVVALNDLNTSTAVEVVYEHILKEWKSASCKKQTIEGYMKALETIEKAESAASSNPNVDLIKKVYGVYGKACHLAHKSFGLTPHFNGDSWNSYSDYAKSIESQKHAILNNDKYKTYLSNITEIKNGLAGVTSRLSSGRADFYHSLANRIQAYYRAIPQEKRKRSDLKRLRNAYSSYINEYKRNSSLDWFVKSFSEDVNHNEEKENYIY